MYLAEKLHAVVGCLYTITGRLCQIKLFADAEYHEMSGFHRNPGPAAAANKRKRVGKSQSDSAYHAISAVSGILLSFGLAVAHGREPRCK